MKIQSVQSYNSTNTNKTKNNYLSSSPLQVLSNSLDIYSPSFGVSGMNLGGKGLFGSTTGWKKLNILQKTKSEVIDLAEYFHKKNDLYTICKGGDDFWSIWRDDEIASKESKILSEAVENVVAKKLKMVQRISELEIKKTLGISNATDQKTRLNREFISLIAAEKEGKEPPIKNGILVHGTSKEKDSFINWLTESAGAVVKTIQHDSNNPTKTTDTLIDIAESAERAFKHSRTRTVVVVKDLDKMLTNKNSAEAMDNINEFKSIAEDLSQRYHTTVITKTDKHLEQFEPATIASNRLGIHVDLKDGIPEKELKELETLKAEVKRLDDKADSAFWKFKS